MDACVEHLIQYDPLVSNPHQGQGNAFSIDDADILIESEELQQPLVPSTSNTNTFPVNQFARNTGAIPKSKPMDQTQFPTVSTSTSHPFPWPTSSENAQPNMEAMSFSSFLKNDIGGNQFVDNLTPRPEPRPRAIIPDHPELKKIVYDIKQGYRVMVVMRGAPGSGKSHLARSIIDQTMNGDYENHIFSTDDFFYDKRQKKYVFNPEFLDTAHTANQAKVGQRAINGWSPIIVDNTNIKLWEMVPYVRDGVKNGYLIKMLEPNTAWARTAGKLTLKNKHNVPRHSIERMLCNFESSTLEEFLTLFKLDYTHPVPIRRNHPSITDGQPLKPENSAKSVGSPVAKEQRRPRQQQQQQPMILNNVVAKDESDTLQLAAQQIHSVNNEWIAFDPEKGLVPWDSEQPASASPQTVKPKEQRVKQVLLNQPPQLNGIYNLLRDRHDSVTAPEQSENTEMDEESNWVKLVKHEKGCPNENESFQQIRHIYPNISISFLWDLFEKCNGDGDWTMDILLKDEDTTTNFNGLETPEMRRDNFTCNCKSGQSDGAYELQMAANALPATLLLDHSEPPPGIQPPPGFPPPQPPTQAKTSRRDRVETESESQIRRQIEEQFEISDDHYSPHVRKIRDFRRGYVSSPTEAESTTSTLMPQDMDVDEQCAGGGDIGAEGDELIEVDLGVELVCQLDNVFGADAFQRDSLKDIKTTVFLPRTLGQQLYAIWMESLYNQIEEQRQTSVKEDEEFAKQLQLKEKYPKLAEKTTSNNLKDIIEMEYAWKAYKSDVDEWKRTTPQDLASKMTRAKLFELFPNVNRETLVEVLAAHDNKFDKTVEVLKSSLESDIENQVEAESQRLLTEVNAEAQVRHSAHSIVNYSVQAQQRERLLTIGNSVLLHMRERQKRLPYVKSTYRGRV